MRTLRPSPRRSRPGRRLAAAARAISILAVAALPLSLGACVHLIAPYDDLTQQAIFAAARGVDQFYGELLEADAGKRPYAKFAERYVQIDTDLRALLLRNEVRPLNEDSTNIARTLLTLWEEKKEQHRRRDGYPDGVATLDRARFARLFKYAARAERAKPDEDGDGGAPSGGDGRGGGAR